MSITHLGHACVLVETSNARLLIDPGTMSSFADVTDLDAILVTHEHPDHVDHAGVRSLLAANPSVQLFADVRTAKVFRDVSVLRAVEPGVWFDVAGTRVDVLGGAHAPVYGDVPDCPNLAYLVGNGDFLHPGDSFFVPPQAIDTLAVPIDGPWLKLSEAVDYVRAVRPVTVLPIHEGELTDPAKYVVMLNAFAQQ